MFAVGVLTTGDPSGMSTALADLRATRQWDREWHFTRVTLASLDAHLGLVDALAALPDWRFVLYVADREAFDVHAACPDEYAAYQAVSGQALAAAHRDGACQVVMSDARTTPARVRFERGVRDDVNARLGCRAVGNVIAVDSAVSDLVQACDVVTSAWAHPYRRPPDACPPSPKALLSDRVREVLEHRIAVEAFDPAWLPAIALAARSPRRRAAA